MQPSGCLEWEPKLSEFPERLCNFGDRRNRPGHHAAHPDLCASTCGRDGREGCTAVGIHRHFEVCCQGARNSRRKARYVLETVALNLDCIDVWRSANLFGNGIRIDVA